MEDFDFCGLFQPSNGFYHLNAGTLSRTPLTVIDSMHATRLEEEQNPTAFFYRSYPKIWQVQKKIAQFLGADPKDIFFRSNITTALSDFLFAVPLPKQGEILVTGWEYGATALTARKRAEQSNLKYRELFFPNPQDLKDPVALLMENIGEARLVVFSHIATGNGEIFPVCEMANALREKGIVVVVDGAHAIGDQNINISEWDAVDFYGGNFHKWFLGPKGTAFGWVNPRWKGCLDWKFGGWATYELPTFYQNFGDGDFDAAQRFFPGTIDPIPFFALEEVLDLWLRSATQLRRRQRFLRDLVTKEMQKDFLLVSSSRNGPLVSFKLPDAWQGRNTVELATELYQKKKVQLAVPKVQGESLLRLSPGVYISEEEAMAGVRAVRDFFFS